MFARFRKFLDVRPGEGMPVLFTSLYTAIAVGSFLLAKPIRNGLFLEEFGASRLVYVYVAVPLALSVLVPLYNAIAKRLGQRVVITASLLFLSGNVLAFWWALTYRPAPWLSGAFYVWVNCYGVIAPVQAWTFANGVFDTRQARRLFGLVGAGASVGAIVGGLLARTLVGVLGTVNLLLVLAALIAGAAVVVNAAWHVLRRDRDRDRSGLVPTATTLRRRRRGMGFRETLRLIFRSSYLQRIALLVMLVAIVTQWTQFQFQAAAERQFAGNADRLTRFFGDFNSIMGVIALLVQVLLTGPALRRFGLGATILLLPVLLGAGVTAIVLTGALWAVLLTSAFDQGLRFSIDKATFELLYLPIPSTTKGDVKGTIDLILNRIADAIGGVLLGVATTGFFGIPGAHLGLRGVAAVNLVFIAGWIVVALALRQGYVKAIQDSISRHLLEAERGPGRVLDRSTTEMLASRVRSSDPKEIVYALRVFQAHHPGATHPSVRGLLAYPNPEVRREAISVLDDAGDVASTRAIEPLLEDVDPGVRAQALLFLARHANLDPLSRIGAPTQFADFSVQASLVAFLGRESPWHNREAATLVLQQMIADTGPAGKRARLEAARLLAQLHDGFDGELDILIRDADEEVARAAIASAGHPSREHLADAVIARLEDHSCRDTAADALAAMGPSVVDELRAALEDPARSMMVRCAIPDVLAAIGGADARAALLENLLEADVSLRAHVIAGLSRLHARHRDLEVERRPIEMMLTAEIMGHYRSYQIVGSIGSTIEGSDPVAQGVRHAMEQEQERIFGLLDPLLPDTDMKSVYLALRSQNRSLRANALELLDNVLSPELRELVVPLFDGQVTVEERIALANKRVGAPVESREDAARAMLASEDSWLKACGAYVVGTLRLTSLRALVQPLTAAADPLLRETARAAIARLSVPAVAPRPGRRPAAPQPAPDSASYAGVGDRFGVG